MRRTEIMSFVKPTKSSSTSYRTPKLYPLKGSNNTPGLSTQELSSEKHNTLYISDSPSDESYEKYFLDYPTEEIIDSSYSGNLFSPHGASYQLSSSSFSSMGAQIPLRSSFVSKRDHDPYRSNSETGYLESLSPEDPVDYDDDQMRLKLQELESALLDDVEMEIEGEWADPVPDDFFHDSPKESSSSESYISSINSNKGPPQISPRTPKQLLLDCAAALSEENIEEASTMIDQLRQMVSIQGDPPQRIAAYMVEGLAARLADSGKCLYKALKCKEPPSSDRLAAMQVLFEVCPCFKFGFVAANGAIIEACKGETRVHIIDFDINQGTQYITLIQNLANQPGKPPHLRLTGVDDPESVQRPVGGLKVIGQRLEKLAEVLRVPFEFRALASTTAIVTPSMLECRTGEALIVNFAFQLHHMPDESVSTVNLRDQLLRMVKSLDPKLVTVVEQDMNTNTAPFIPRFMEAYNYYFAVFESLDATLPRESQERMNVERQCLARDIVNIVACEGDARIERYEVAGKWRARMKMAGFTSCPISETVLESIRKLIREYCDLYKVKEEMGALHFGWRDKSLIVASAWK